jgi:hypothetical protein
VRVLYDDRALYVGVTAHDSDPSKIVARLCRRDTEPESDRITIAIDSYMDRRTGYAFSVNAAGVQSDKYLFDDVNEDASWDAVWRAEVHRFDGGWSTEFEIPLSVLRFKPAAAHHWGFQVVREIPRKREELWWSPTPKAESRVVSRFGHLNGIAGIRAPRRLEVLPYTVSRATLSPKDPFANPDGRKASVALGGDVKYGLSSNVTVDATFNPDFGQVEADPSVLNLGVFETRFQEKRPFFIEGSKSFGTPFTLFFSRRIGRRPGRFSLQEGDAVIERPDATTILGAAKITGKTPGGTAFGIVEAVTDEERAFVENRSVDPETEAETTTRLHRVIEPRSNYLVGRLSREFGNGTSSVGLLGTAVHREGSTSAYTGGLDWLLKTRDSRYTTRGQVVGSHAGPDGNRADGTGAIVNLSKEGGKWTRAGIGGEFESRKLRLNDLGFLNRSDNRSWWSWFQLRQDRRLGPIKASRNNVNFWQAWNWDGLRIDYGGNFNNNVEFTNSWWAGGGIDVSARTMSDLDTRGGPPIVRPARTHHWLWFDTDSRRTVVLHPFIEWGSSKAGGWWNGKSLGIDLQPKPNQSYSVRVSENAEFNPAQWVGNVDDEGDGTADHFVYGELLSHVVSVTGRANVTFTKYLTLQLYMQPFLATGKYGNYKELARPASFEFRPYPWDANQDFSFTSLNSNLVLRWEYRPGSTLFLVWSQIREGSGAPGVYRPARDLGEVFGAEGENTFLVKMNYRLDL